MLRSRSLLRRAPKAGSPSFSAGQARHPGGCQRPAVQRALEPSSESASRASSQMLPRAGTLSRFRRKTERRPIPPPSLPRPKLLLWPLMALIAALRRSSIGDQARPAQRRLGLPILPPERLGHVILLGVHGALLIRPRRAELEMRSEWRIQLSRDFCRGSRSESGARLSPSTWCLPRMQLSGTTWFLMAATWHWA